MAIIKTATENHSCLFQNDWSDMNQVTFNVYAAEFLRETLQSHFNANKFTGHISIFTIIKNSISTFVLNKTF